MNKNLHRLVFNHARGLRMAVQMRTLYCRDDQRGLTIKTFQGNAVLPEEARLWFESHLVVHAPISNFTSLTRKLP